MVTAITKFKSIEGSIPGLFREVSRVQLISIFTVFRTFVPIFRVLSYNESRSLLSRNLLSYFPKAHQIQLYEMNNFITKYQLRPVADKNKILLLVPLAAHYIL